MSYKSEHRRMQPLLDVIRKLGIATNPAPEALYEAGTAGFQLWCTPDDHPEGWEEVQMTRGAFAKPCAYVGSVIWGWSDDSENPQIIRLLLTTDSYALLDHFGGTFEDWHNRDEDIAWALVKIEHVFALAGVEPPPIDVRP